MKKFMILAFVGSMLVGMVGCGKTLAELRTDGDAIVDNATSTATQTIGIVGVVAKKLIAVGFSIYDLGKKMVGDTTDNVVTVTDTVIPTKP